jgi:chromosomal replication initiator protein
LADIFVGAKRVVRLPDIERAVCETFGLEPKVLRSSGKSRAAAQPRMLAMWLARKYTRLAFSEISEFFGRRSHSTVISAEQKVNRWVGDGARLQLGPASWTIEEAIRRLETKLRTG